MVIGPPLFQRICGENEPPSFQWRCESRVSFEAPEGRSVAGDWEFEPGVGRSHEHPMEKARLQHGPLHAPCVCSFQIRIFEYAPCGKPGNRLTLSNRSDSALSER